MSNEVEVQPPLEYIEAVRTQVIRPLLNNIAHEIEFSLKARVDVFLDGSLALMLGEELAILDEESDPWCGEFRVRFRDTFIERRYLFFVDSRFEANSRASTFSGVQAFGDVKEQGSEILAGYKTWIVKREDTEWGIWR